MFEAYLKRMEEKVAKVYVISKAWFSLSCFYPPVDTNSLLSKSSVSWQHLNAWSCVSRPLTGGCQMYYYRFCVFYSRIDKICLGLLYTWLMRSSSNQSEEPQNHNSISGDNASGLLKNARAHISPSSSSGNGNLLSGRRAYNKVWYLRLRHTVTWGSEAISEGAVYTVCVVQFKGWKNKIVIYGKLMNGELVGSGWTSSGVDFTY